jgi:hypothetical protein
MRTTSALVEEKVGGGSSRGRQPTRGRKKIGKAAAGKGESKT